MRKKRSGNAALDIMGQSSMQGIKGTQGAQTAVFALMLLSVYTEAPLFITDTFFIPSFMTLCLMPVMFALVRRSVYYSDFGFLTVLALVLLLTAVLSPGSAYLNEKMTGVAQTTLSVASGVLFFKLAGRLDRIVAARVLFIFAIVLVAGTFLEVVGLLKGVSDAFREMVFSRGAYGVYEVDVRDIELVGFSRPKLFTSEPSLLAIGFFAFINSWLLAAYTRRNMILALALTVLMMAMVGSPVLLISCAVTFAVIMYNARNPVNMIKILFASALALGVCFIVAAYFTGIFDSLIARFEHFNEYGGTIAPTSENIRLFFPVITMLDVLSNSPYFGVGISGKEVIAQYQSLPIDPLYAFGNNNLTALLTYLGIAGTVLFIAVFWRYIGRLGVSRKLLLLAMVVGLTQSMGGLETFRFWGYVFLFMAAIKMNAELREARSRAATAFEKILDKRTDINEGSLRLE